MKKRSGATLTAMCLAVLMVQLDTTVVNLALRPIQTSLHTGIATLQWVIDAYNLVYATFILSGAILGDRFGRKRLFLLGVALFGIGTLVSAVSPSALVLVLSRVITGLGAAMALPISLSIVTATYADEGERNRAIGIWSGVNGIAIALGPTVGGVLVDHFGWRAIFWMFLPVIAVAFALTWSAVSESKSDAARSLDWAGQALAITTLGCFTFAAIEGPVLHWSSWIFAAFGCSLLSLGAFIAIERRAAHPLVALQIFENAGFTGAILVTFAMTFGMYAFMFIVPNYLQSVTGFSALVAGVLLLPTGALFAAMSPFVGRWMGVAGPRRLIVAGMVLQASGFLLTLALGREGPIWVVVVQTTLLGLALGCETGPLMSVAMASVPKDRFGMPSGVVNVARLTGATVGVAVLGSILASHLGAAFADPDRFIAGMRLAMLVAAGVAFIAGVTAALTLGRRPGGIRRFSGRNAPVRGSSSA